MFHLQKDRFQYTVKHVARLLKFSAIQNLYVPLLSSFMPTWRAYMKHSSSTPRIPKFGFAIYLMIWWGFHQMRNNNTTLDIAYSVIFFLCLFTLIPTQIYGSRVLWKVANGMMKRRNSNQVEAADQEKDRATSFGDEAGEEDLDEMESLAEQLRRQHGETQSRPWDLSARSSYTLQGSVTTTGKEV